MGLRDLMGDELFTVSSLMTPLSETLCVKREESYFLEEKAKKAKCGDFDNLPFWKNGELQGFVRVSDIHKHNYDLDAIPVMPIRSFSIDQRKTLHEAIDKIKACEAYHDNPVTDEPNLYFVTTEDGPVGVLTYADLNRKSCYVYSYIMLMSLEQALREAIEKAYSKIERKNAWMGKLRPGQQNRLKGLSIDQKESTLSCAGLEDMVVVVENDPAVKKIWEMRYKGIGEETLDSAVKMRNRIAHPNKLLVPRNKRVDCIKGLSRFWKDMHAFVLEYDKNSRNPRAKVG